MTRPLCLIAGHGDGVGASMARVFAGAGYDLVLISRSGRGADGLPDGATAHAIACDVSDSSALGAALSRVESQIGPVDTLLWNADTGAFGTLEDITQERFDTAWRVNVAGLFAAAKLLGPAMAARGGGNIIISGATASLRGAPMTVAFAPAKSGQRALAQSLAKALGPNGVHVALMIIDAVVGTPENRAAGYADKPDGYFADPDEIAKTALYLVGQDRSAWTFEMDLRPASERW